MNDNAAKIPGGKKNTGKEHEEYVLVLTPEQALAVEHACEILARLEIGQFNIITEQLLEIRNVDDYCFRRDVANSILKSAACLILGMNHYGNPDAKIHSDRHNRAWSVYEVLRYTRSWHKNPAGGFTVNYDKPLPINDEPLPKCEILTVTKEKGDESNV